MPNGPETVFIGSSILLAADDSFDAQNYGRALELYRSVLDQLPDDIEALTGTALCLVHLDRQDEALPLLLSLEKHMPDSDQLQFMLLEAQLQSGFQEQAEELLKRMVIRFPANVKAQIRLGRLYLDRGEYQEANRWLAAALEVEPNNVEALSYMGLMMIKFCQYDNAVTVLTRAYAKEPENVLVLNNLGRASKVMGHHEDAIKWYGKGLEVEPGNQSIISNYLFLLNYCHGLTPEFIAAEHFRLAPLYLDQYAPEPSQLQLSPSSDKLRIGYISGDLYTHSVAYYFEPVLQHHDYQRFDVFCYSTGVTKDATTRRLESLPCHWREMTAVHPKRLAEQVRKDRIDILVDLTGHTGDNRLSVFAVRSAPIQISWIGYPNTSGLKQMDYYVTDAICDPPGMTDHLYSESLWRLPRTFCCYLPPMEFPVISPAPFLSNGHITFGSFNNFAKVTRQQIKLWGQILMRVPDSRLYLKSLSLGDVSVKQDVLAKFAEEGIAPERITLKVVTSTPLEHLQEYAQVDIAFDTFPYHGTTTTCEALWMGTPVITLAGSTHVSRVGVSLLHNVDCDELVASSPEEYIEKTVALAQSPRKLISLRENLRAMMAGSPLMDAAGVTHELEEAFFDMAGRAGRTGKSL